MTTTTARQQYRIFTGSIWFLGVCGWFTTWCGQVNYGSVVVLMAVVLTVIRETVFSLEVRGLDKL